MRKNRILQNGVGQFSHHRELDLRHDFAAFDAQHGGAKNLTDEGSTSAFMNPRVSPTSRARAT